MRLTRAESILSEKTLVTAPLAGTVRACISTIKTRLPSQTGTAAEPAGRGPVRLVINNEDGSSMAFKPLSSIKKIPSSSTEPKRFFRARKKRTSSSVLSKEMTVSTRCSRTLGPAMFPSFVTWAVKNKTLSLSLTQDTSS